jgi:hypothetical protein
MAWYIRKSFKLSSLLRVNLSKSGLGYSFGVKGARIGTGPRGNYIHLGRYGLYYRQSLPSFGTEGKADSNSAPMAKAVPGPEQEVPIITADVSALKDHSAQQLLTEIQEKHGIMRVAPIVSAVFGLTILLSLVLQLSLWLSGFLIIAAFIAYLRLARFDRERKTVALHFELDDFARARYEALSSTLQSFANSSAIWILTSQQSVIDPKYHAGAATIVDKTLARMALGAPPFVQTEITVWRLTLRDQTLYLFPDRILVYQGNEVGAILYCDLHLSLQETRFVEKSYVPADAAVVDHTWRYTNRDGGPDRRFANNSQIPVVRYGEIHITRVTLALGYIYAYTARQTGGSATGPTECNLKFRNGCIRWSSWSFGAFLERAHVPAVRQSWDRPENLRSGDDAEKKTPDETLLSNKKCETCSHSRECRGVLRGIDARADQSSRRTPTPSAKTRCLSKNGVGQVRRTH